MSRNALNHFLWVLIHSTQLQLISTCVWPLQVSSVPVPRTAWRCWRWCRFSGTPFQLITVEGHRDISFVQTSIQPVLQAPLWQWFLLFTPDIYLKTERSLRMPKPDLRCFKTVKLMSGLMNHKTSTVRWIIAVLFNYLFNVSLISMLGTAKIIFYHGFICLK